MSSTMRLQSSLKTAISVPSPPITHLPKTVVFTIKPSGFLNTVQAVSSNGAASRSSCKPVSSSSVEDAHRQRSSLESLFCYDKAIPEEIIEKPIGLSLSEKATGDNARCTDCLAKGAVLCRTCSGSGLYVDSILESQGIIVKVRCLGCGGTGNVLCSDCGGRGHLGYK